VDVTSSTFYKCTAIFRTHCIKKHAAWEGENKENNKQGKKMKHQMQQSEKFVLEAN
jgi:hypothetical protein